MGSNKLHTSLNKGDNWSFKSKDLTNGIKKGNVPYGTISTLDESIFKFGKIVTGSDDGLIQISNDGGNSWELISKDLPQKLWVSRVIFSKHNENRIYATLNGYRNDDFSPYVYVTNDNGKSWENISSNLPKSSVNVIKEDPHVEDIVYLGTDNGAYISLNKGDEWAPFSNGINKVAVHDLVIQKDNKDLLLATHGRSIYKTNLSVIYSMLEKSEKKKEPHYIYVEDIRFSSRWGKKTYNWSDYNIPKKNAIVFSDTKQKNSFVLLNSNDKVLSKRDITLLNGFQYVNIPIEFDESEINKKNKNNFVKSDNNKFYLKKGKYKLKIGSSIEFFEIK